jgi:hypothetical protein
MTLAFEWEMLGSGQAGMTSGAGCYGIKTSNDVGLFNLRTRDNPELIEKSDPECFTDNEAFSHFATLRTRNNLYTVGTPPGASGD